MASIKSYSASTNSAQATYLTGDSMATITKEVNIAKEADDVLAAIVLIVKDVKAGKSLLEIGSDALPALITAVGGIDQVPAELADRKLAMDTVFLRVSEILDVLVAPAVKAEVAQVEAE